MDMGQSEFDTVAHSRGGAASPFGKLERELKTHIDEDTYNLYLQEAARRNVLPGVLLREDIYKRARGKYFTQLCADHVVAQLDREGPDQGGAA